MRALLCLALVAAIAAPIARAADPPDADSAQAKRERFINGGDPPVTKDKSDTQSSSNSNPSPPDQAGPPADVTPPPPPPSLTPYQRWLTSLQQMPQGGWQLLDFGGGDNSDGLVVYFSTHHMTVDGRVVTAWFRWEYETGQTQGITNYRSSVTREVIDCNKDATKVVADAFYPDQNLGGNVANSDAYDPSQVRWSPIIPGTLGEDVLNWACEKAVKNLHQKKAR